MLVTVSSHSLPYEAHLDRGRLESEGIPAFVADEHTINMQWLYSNALGGVRVQVPEQFAEQALEILRGPAEGESVVEDRGDFPACPVCGSDDTEYRRLGKRLAFLVFLGLDFPLFPTRNGVKCNACGEVSELP